MAALPKRKKGKKGPQTPEGMARAIANLRPAKKGEVRNPKGRPAAGATVKEWLNVMQDWTREELTKVIDDDASPASKVAAARSWLDASSTARNAAGNPVAIGDLERICDRTDGKPVNHVDARIEHTGPNGGPLKTETTHTFDNDRFANLYRSRTRGNPAGSGLAPVNGN